MAAHWWWSWSIGLSSTAYANSSWAIRSIINTVTNSTEVLNEPDPSSNAPGEEYCLKLIDTSINTPAFPDGSISQGWVITRWNASGTGGFNSGVKILDLISGDTVRVQLRPGSGTTAPLSLYVNGTLVGTTTGAYGDATAVLAIDFDLTQTPPQAGLVVNGIREIDRDSGSGSPTTIDRISMGTGKSTSSNVSYFGDFAVFNSLTDFSSDATTQDVWVTFLDPNAVTDSDNSWTPSAGTDLTDINDASISTYVQTTTDPDSLSIEFESTTDRLTGWSPTLIYGVAAITYGNAAVITSTTLTMNDSNGVVGTETTTQNAIGEFVGVWKPLDSSGNAWTAFEVNSIDIDYEVSS